MLNLILSFFISFLVVIFITPLMIYIAKKKNLLDQPSDRKEHIEPKPLLGGVGIFIATILCVILFTEFSSTLLLIILVVGSLGIAIMGLIDDILSLSAKIRLLILFVVAIIIYIACFQFYLDTQSLLARRLFPILAFSFFIIFWIVGVTNAINFSDGLDGLASYISLISVMSFAIIFAYQDRATLALPFALTLAGAIAGFIPYNRNPAQIFMGDTGSMFIGFMLSLLSIACIRLENTLYAIIVPVYLIFIPIIDMVMSILRRIITRKPIMMPDKMHFHHQLNKRFSNHTVVVIILALAQVIFSTAGIIIFINKQYILGSVIIGFIILILAIYTFIKGLRQRKLESVDTH